MWFCQHVLIEPYLVAQEAAKMRLWAVFGLGVVFNSVLCFERHKRVINGVPLDGRPSTYSAIRYYGAITSAHRSAAVRKIQSLFGVYGDIWCSGSLITPKIVQSACHCFFAYYFVKWNTDMLQPAVVADQWEGKYLIFFGVSKKFGEGSWYSTEPVLTKRFFLHHECAKLRDSSLNTYDYAIVTLAGNWWDDKTANYAWSEIDFAPQYTSAQIKAFYDFAQIKQFVCLHIGFGTYKHLSSKKSDVLLTGWTALLPKKICWDIARYVYKFPAKVPFTWTCTFKFPQHDSGSGQADSGGPVTCDNKYFAIQESRLVHAPLFYTLYINAVEYRDNLVKTLDKLTATYRDQVYEVFTTKRHGGFALHNIDSQPTSQGLTQSFAFKIIVSAFFFFSILFR